VSNGTRNRKNGELMRNFKCNECGISSWINMTSGKDTIGRKSKKRKQKTYRSPDRVLLVDVPGFLKEYMVEVEE
jgi:hypothetical protein